MKHTDTPIKAYKVTDKNVQCRGFQFEIGVEYRSDIPVRCGNSGFHSCLKAADCFRYYDFNPINRVFEVEIWGDYEDDDENDSKVASQYIRFTKELTWQEVSNIVNTGKNNTGIGNTGNWNTGDGNTGDGNTGNKNTGIGNTGIGNTGDGNTGDWNTGGGNTGNYNSANYSTGFFNSQEADLIMFNKPTGLKRNEISIPYIGLVLTEWVYYTDAEMESDESKKLIGGYLRKYGYKEAWANWHKTATQRQIYEIKALPNFDADVFFEITGLRI